MKTAGGTLVMPFEPAKGTSPAAWALRILLPLFAALAAFALLPSHDAHATDWKFKDSCSSAAKWQCIYHFTDDSGTYGLRLWYDSGPSFSAHPSAQPNNLTGKNSEGGGTGHVGYPTAMAMFYDSSLSTNVWAFCIQADVLFEPYANSGTAGVGDYPGDGSATDDPGFDSADTLSWNQDDKNLGNADLKQVDYLLRAAYPNPGAPSPTAQVTNPATKTKYTDDPRYNAAAVQAAIWHFTDKYNLSATQPCYATDKKGTVTNVNNADGVCVDGTKIHGAYQWLVDQANANAKDCGIGPHRGSMNGTFDAGGQSGNRATADYGTYGAGPGYPAGSTSLVVTGHAEDSCGNGIPNANVRLTATLDNGARGSWNCDLNVQSCPGAGSSTTVCCGPSGGISYGGPKGSDGNVSARLYFTPPPSGSTTHINVYVKVTDQWTGRLITLGGNQSFGMSSQWGTNDYKGAYLWDGSQDYYVKGPYTPVMSTPAASVAAGTCGTLVNLSWSYPVSGSGIDSLGDAYVPYNFVRQTQPSVGRWNYYGAAKSTSFTVVPDGSTYQWMVYGFNAAGYYTSAYSNTVRPLPCLPGAVVARARETCNGSDQVGAHIEWARPANDGTPNGTGVIDFYRITASRRGSAGTPLTWDAPGDAGQASKYKPVYDVPWGALENGTQYFFIVRAHNIVGFSDDSPFTNSITPTCSP